MRIARTIASALLILTGAACLVAWVLGTVTVRAVTDPGVVSQIVGGATSQSQVRDSVVILVQAQVRSQVSAQGLDLNFLGLGNMLDGAVDRAITNESLTAMAQDQAVEIQRQLASELQRQDRSPGPLVLHVDVSGIVNSGLSDITLGALSFDVDVPPVAIDVMPTQEFEQARTTYSLMEFAARWCGWLGAAALLLGLALSHRRRWFVTKAAGAIALGALILWSAITVLSQPDPRAYNALREAVIVEGTQLVLDRALMVAAIAALIALISAGIAIATKPSLGRHRA